MKNNYPRGSEWRKWDLHVHTPCSIVENYGGDTEEAWDKFLDDLEKLPADFKVIGVNDYLFLEGYKRLCEEKEKNNRLKNIDLLLPVVEFRIQKFAGTDFGPLKRINLHVIFSESVKPEIIQTQFLNAIIPSYQLSPGIDGFFWSGVISIESLEDLGKKIKESVPAEKVDDYGIDLIEGFNNLNVNEEKLFEVLDNSSYFQGEYLVAIGKTEWDELKWTDSSIAEKKDIINKADIVFTAASSAGAFHKAKEKLQDQSVNSLLLDCSDAHSFSDKEGEKDKIGNCFSWIKANPSFEGLKQIIYEPDVRIHVGDSHPESRDENRIIKSIKIENSNGWFEEDEIPLNSSQVSIIGGKGSGKTALLDLIAFGADAWDGTAGESFLKKANRSLSGANVTLKWLGGDEVKHQIDKGLSQRDEPRVKYLSQKFVEDLCSNDQEGHELVKEIEKVVFEYIEETDKHGCADFNELKHEKLDAIKEQRKSITREVEDINSYILKDIMFISSKDEKQQQLKELSKEKEGLLKQKPELNTEEEKQSEQKLQDLRQVKQTVDENISLLKSKVDKTERIGLKLGSFQRQMDTFYSDIEQELIDIDLPETVRSNFKPIFGGDAEKLLSDKLVELKTGIDALVGGDDDEYPTQKTQKAITKSISGYEGKLSEDKAKQEKILKTQRRITSIYKEISKLEKEIKDIDENRVQKLKGREEKRWESVKRYFENLKKEQEVLRALYRPLDDYLGVSSEEKKSLSFYIQWVVDLEKWAKNGEMLLNRTRKGAYRSEGDLLASAQEYLKSALEEGDYDEYKKSLEKFRGTFETADYTLSGQLRDDVTLGEFDDWLYSLEHISLNYGIKYNDIELENLSPGTKGIVLLILYLEMDKYDVRPILIDQPEENLDNESVYKILTQYFREAKNRRQVILVTHNPNLVVNTDSEQVITATFLRNPSLGPRITYYSGALEDTNKSTFFSEMGIRERVCEVLEGGEDAFHMREKKYNLFKTRNICQHQK
jgi:ABC-type transport system involved in cytochrome c biogenesis ATPase subunit